eukprot:scaffold65540_cov36-Phaeocystis_antarctica.AAC.2
MMLLKYQQATPDLVEEGRARCLRIELVAHRLGGGRALDHGRAGDTITRPRPWASSRTRS